MRGSHCWESDPAVIPFFAGPGINKSRMMSRHTFRSGGKIIAYGHDDVPRGPSGYFLQVFESNEQVEGYDTRMMMCIGPDVCLGRGEIAEKLEDLGGPTEHVAALRRGEPF